MPREKPPGWVDPPADHGGSTRRADVILGKMLVNRNLNRMLMRRAQADLVADAVAEPGAARPEFKLVFDTRGRSTFKVRCAFDSEKTAQGYGFDDLVLKIEWAKQNNDRERNYDRSAESVMSKHMTGYGKALAQDTTQKVSYSSSAKHNAI